MMLIPGPVEVPPSVLEASAKVMNHRSDEFREIVRESQKLLNEFADSTQSIITTGSGTLAVESMIFSMTRKGEKVLGVTFGEFGDRLMESLERRGCNLKKLNKTVDDVLEKGEITDFLSKNGEIDTVCLVHNETGNGTSIKNIKSIAEECNGLGLKVLVDSVSGFGGMPIEVNGWGIDAIATCSQKGLASVPGLGIVCLGNDANSYIASDRDFPKYLDIGIGLSFAEKGETAFTPSTGSFNALLRALKILRDESLETRLHRHSAIAEFLRKNIENGGGEVLGNERNYSDTVVAFKPSIEPHSLQSALRTRGFEVAGGMGKLHGKIVRVGNMGVLSGEKAAAFLNEYFRIVNSTEHIEPEDVPDGTSINYS